MAKKSYRYIYMICFSVLLCLAVVYLLYRTKEGFQGKPSIDLVVARYEEDISWVNELPIDSYSQVYIYNKGSDSEFSIPKSTVIPLPNYGRESHTYLYHVIQNYDRLSDVTFFVPGSGWHRDDKKKRIERIADYLKTSTSSMILGHREENYIKTTYDFSIDTWEVTNEANKKKNSDTTLMPALDRPLRNWFEKRFPNESITFVSYTGIFAASREDIRKKPKEFYEALFREHLHTNPEVVHYSERLWKNIFSIDDKHCIS